MVDQLCYHTNLKFFDALFLFLYKDNYYNNLTFIRISKRLKMVDTIFATVKRVELQFPISAIICSTFIATIIRISCRGCVEVLCQMLGLKG